MIPNFKVLAPATIQELASMLYTLLVAGELNGPTAIRYPRLSEAGTMEDIISSMGIIKLLEWEKLVDGTEGAILATGSMVDLAGAGATESDFSLYNCRSIKPIDTERLRSIFDENRLVICMEEGIRNGGFGSAVSNYASDIGYGGKVLSISINDVFSEHGSRKEILSDLSLDRDSIRRKLLKLRGENYAYNNGIRKD